MKIDPTKFAADHPLSIAMRRVSRHWHLAYSKLLSLEWEWCSDFPYGATDGKSLLLNRKGIDQLAAMPDGVEYIAFLLVHESLHALLGHGWRLAALKNAKLGNVAADYVINAMIQMRNRELKADAFPIIPGALLDEALSGDKSVEQLYRELLQPDPNPQPQPQPQDSNENQDQDDSEEGSGQEGDQDPEEDGDDCGTDDDDGEPGDDGNDSGVPTGEDGDDGGGAEEEDTSGDRPADDDDMGGADVDADGGEPDLKDFPGKGGVDTCAPEPEEGETYKEAIDRIEEDNDRLLTSDAIDRQTMSDTGQTGRRMAGMRNQGYQMPWTDLLREWLNHHSRAGWDSPFNQAIHASTGLVAAGRRKKAAGHIVWVLDTSGSIGQATYDRFLGEAQVALDDLKPESMTLLSVSHIVCDAVILESGDRVPDSLKGGGGTAFLPAFNWVANNDIEPDVLVYLTDGESPDIGRLVAPDYPVLWLSTRRPQSHYPFGEVAMVTGL